MAKIPVCSVSRAMAASKAWANDIRDLDGQIWDPLGVGSVRRQYDAQYVRDREM